MTTDVSGASTIATPIPNVMMNSLMSPTKIITDDPIQSPILASVALPDKLPVACLPPPVSVIGQPSGDGALGQMDEDSFVVVAPVPEPIEVEEDELVDEGDEEPMEECANTVSLSSPKQPASLKSDDVVMAENLSVSEF